METLNTLRARDKAAAAWAHLLVIGAGDGRQGSPWGAVAAQRRDLVEADPQRAARLQAALGRTADTQVWPDVVAPQSSSTTWHHYNLERLDGIFDADALRDLYPRLARLSQRPVQAIGLGDFIARLGLDPEAGQDRLLVIDVPGSRRLLEAAADHPALQTFACLALRDPLDPADSDETPELDARLARAGYRLGPAETGWRVYELDPSFLERQALSEALESSRRRVATLEAQVAAHELACTPGVIEAPGDDHEAERLVLREQAELLQERGRQLEHRLAEAESRVAALDHDKQTLTTERDSAQKSLQDKTKRLQTLETELADARRRLDLTTQEIARAEGQLELLKELFLQEASL
jgi:hypothetical protein